jgi:hypothetical protein
MNAGDQFGANAHVGMMRSSMRMSIVHHDAMTRRVSRARITAAEDNEMFIELDSHADTVCVGANCRVIEYKQEVVNVELTIPPTVQSHAEYQCCTSSLSI